MNSSDRKNGFSVLCLLFIGTIQLESLVSSKVPANQMYYSCYYYIVFIRKRWI